MMRLSLLTLSFFIVLTTLEASAQYTDRAAMNDLGGPKEFAARRTELCAKLKTGYVLLFAKMQVPAAEHYREDNDFYYYTGLSDPGAIMLMDVATQRASIFEPQQSPREVQVYGPNLLSMSKDQQKELGYPAVAPLSSLDGALSFLFGAGGDRDLWVRLGFADKPDGARFETGRDYAAEYNNPYGQNLPGDRDALLKLHERYPAANFRDITGAMDTMRNIKRPGEIEVLRRNGKISAQGDKQAIAMAHPGMYEYQIEAEAAFVFRNSGAQGLAYPAIVGSGPHANTWHYFFNRDKIESGSIVVFDFAADLDHMTMDITRTFNIDAKFTPEQAKWYNVDLESQKAVIDMLKVGNTYEQAEAAGKKVFEREGIATQWYGFPGHFVGLATHDVMLPKGPIQAGQVITVEPIVEFPDKHWHFRVEDTVLITANGPEILSASIPKEIADVEKLVGTVPAVEPVK
ncbi:MAG TPA: aminopeptidase P N-terminal domain-containing protein [Terriglobales bacterium]|jgi:Xaa-Pro aminopeptidase|nr:aminopeptidase P N-terminal domain-containing protein [Terriglobales bacterium]